VLDPDQVLDEVPEFVSLARDGAYVYGDRRVSRTERSKWRLTFRSLATQAQLALHAADTGPAEQAMELLIDLAGEMGDAEYFHSEDPVEAARFVVSHAVSALSQTMLDQHGFAVFAERAARRLIRWESEYGWTRGDGKVAEHETLLAKVLAPLLTIPQMWRDFAVAYLSALDAVARDEAAAKGKPSVWGSWGWSDDDYKRKSRAGDLAAWHGMLVKHLAGTDAPACWTGWSATAPWPGRRSRSCSPQAGASDSWKDERRRVAARSQFHPPLAIARRSGIRPETAPMGRRPGRAGSRRPERFLR
jgi:hypothetical protein